MGNKFGPAIGAPVAAWLIVHYNWQMMFFITGAAGLVWLVPWLLMVGNDLPKRADMAAIRRNASVVPFANIIASPVVWGAMIVNFCYGYFTFYCMTWMPAYLVEQRGLSLEQSGLYTFFSFAGIAIVAVLAGWAADRIIARGHDAVIVRKAFVIAGFIGACTVLLGAYASSLGMALFWNVFSLSFLGLATANNLALCRLTLIPKPAIGLVTGVQQVATSLAGGVAASLSGWLLHVSGSYETADAGDLRIPADRRAQHIGAAAAEMGAEGARAGGGWCSVAKIVFGMAVPHSGMLGQPPEEWLTNGARDRNNPELWYRNRTWTYPELEAERGAAFEQFLTIEERATRAAKCRAALDEMAAAYARANIDVAIILGKDQKENLARPVALDHDLYRRGRA